MGGVDLVFGQDLGGVDDRRGQAALDGFGEEDAVEHLPRRGVEAERDVAHAEDRLRIGEAARDFLDGVQGFQAVAPQVFLAAAQWHRQCVEEDVLRRQAVLLDCGAVEPFGDLDLAVGRPRLPLLVDGERDDGSAVAAGRAERAAETLAAVLEVDRVDDRLAADQLQPGFEHLRLSRIEHQRQGREAPRPADQLLHVGNAAAADEIDADIGDVRALGGLIADHVGHLLPLAGLEQALEAARAVGVGPLADDQEGGVLLVGRRREERGGGGGQQRFAPRRFQPLDRFHNGAHVLVRGSAAAADDARAVLRYERPLRVRQPFGREVVDRLVVLDPGQSGVGRAEQAGRGVAREVAQRFVHEIGAGRAVEPDAVQIERGERGQRRADLAADQHLPGRLDRDGAEDRQRDAGLAAGVLAGDDRRLALQEVVDGLDQQGVDAALDQAARLFEVAGVQLVEADLAERRQLGARAERADGEPRAGGGREAVGRPPRDAGGGGVDLPRPVAQSVLVQRDRGAAEGVGQHRARAGLEVAGVQRLDRVGAGEVEHLVAAIEPVEISVRERHRLQAGARRAVQHEHLLVHPVQQPGARGVRHLIPQPTERSRRASVNSATNRPGCAI